MDRILLVEDDVELRPLLEYILLDNGFQVVTAENVAVATTLLSSQPFDLVICDVKLPDGNGLIVADKAIAAGVKTLVVTGHGSSLKSGSLTPYDYLLEPLRAPESLNNIDRCLAH